MSRPRQGARGLVVLGQQWWWFAGKGLTVLLWAPDGTKHMAKITGRDWAIVERGQWKKTSDGMLKPRHVRAYIERGLA